MGLNKVGDVFVTRVPLSTAGEDMYYVVINAEGVEYCKANDITGEYLYTAYKKGKIPKEIVIGMYWAKNEEEAAWKYLQDVTG